MSTHARSLLSHLHRLAAPAAPDAVLLQRWTQQHDQDAFAVLMARHGPMVLGICRRLLGDVPETEDVFQATFVVLARQAAQLRQPEALAGFLYTVAVRLARKTGKSRRRRQHFESNAQPPEPIDPRPHPLDVLSGRELLALLDEEMARLPEVYRLPLLLCLLQGRTIEEAARQLGWSIGSLRGRLSRGRERLRRRLARRGLDLCLGVTVLLVPAVVPEKLLAQSLRHLSNPVPAAISALAGGMMPALKMKILGFALVLVTAVGIGSGLSFLQVPVPEKSAAPSAAAPPLQAKDEPHRDLLGDLLPPHVLARLGTSRLRHGGWFTALAYSPDGKTIASAANDGTVRLWDAKSGKAVRVLDNDRERPKWFAFSRWLFCLAFSPDGKRLASGEYVQGVQAGGLHIWNTATGKEELRFRAHPGGVFAVAFSPDGKKLASSGATDGKVRLWDAATGKLLNTLDAKKAAPWLAFHPDGKMLASVSGKLIRLWNSADGTEAKQLQGHRDDITGIAFHPNGKELASVSKDKTLRLWNIVTGRERACLTGPDILHGIAFCPDGKKLATGGVGPIVVWDAATGEEVCRLNHPDGEVTSLAFAPDGKTLATNTTGERCIRLWDLQTGQEHPASAAGHHGSVGFLRFSPDGRSLVSAGCEAVEMCRWKTDSGKRLWRLQRGSRPFARPIDLSPDGKILAAGTQSGEILLVDAVSGKELHCFKAHGALVQGLAFSGDGKMLASSSDDKTLRLWDVASRRLRRSLEVNAAIPFLCFSPDGKILASAAPAGPVELRDAAFGISRLRLEGQNGRICSLTYSPNGRWLAAGTENGSIQVWATDSGKKAQRLAGLPGFVFGLTFSPDSKTVAAGCWMQLRLWETATGGERLRFTDLEGDVFSLAFAPQGRMLASALGDGSILLWDVAGRIAGKRPTNEEIQAAMSDLLGEDADKAYQALRTLASVPHQAMPWLKKKLKPIVGMEQRKMDRLLRQLDDDNFAVREEATRQLAKVVELAEPFLRQALQKSTSAELRRRIDQLLDPIAGPLPSPERVRQLRLLELLEQIGTREARELLTDLAGGAPGVFLTREAKASLERLKR